MVGYLTLLKQKLQSICLFNFFSGKKKCHVSWNPHQLLSMFSTLQVYKTSHKSRKILLINRWKGAALFTSGIRDMLSDSAIKS